MSGNLLCHHPIADTNLSVFFFPQSSSHGAGDQELVSRMKGMELENQTLHKGVLSAFECLPERVLNFTILIVFRLLVSGGGDESSPEEARAQSGFA